MIFFDITDTSIEAVQLSTSFITGEGIGSFARAELEGGLIKLGEIKKIDPLKERITKLLKEAQPRAMKDQECAFTLPDKRAYTCRFALPQRQDSQTVFDLVKDRMEKAIPQSIEELIYRYKSLDKGKGPGEVLLTAVPTAIVNSYVDMFNKLNFQPRLVVPESLAIYNLLKPTIGEEETILYLDIGKTTSTATLMDGRGVVEAFTESVESSKLLNQTEKLINFTHDHFLRTIKRIILGGGGSLKVDVAKIKAELKVEVESAEDALKTFKIPIKVNFGNVPRILFVTTFGLASLSKEKQPLNLLP